MKRVTRRAFLEMSAATGFAALTGVAQTDIKPSRAVRIRKPDEKLNMAFIGSGGRGADNLKAFYELGENIIALCDIDKRRLNGSANQVKERCPDARKYQDYRELLAKENDLDAVVVSTPDHMHAACAIAAMRQGCHVYVEKPLVRTVWECRRFGEVAKACGVFTQMGNNGNGRTASAATSRFSSLACSAKSPTSTSLPTAPSGRRGWTAPRARTPSPRSWTGTRSSASRRCGRSRRMFITPSNGAAGSTSAQARWATSRATA